MKSHRQKRIVIAEVQHLAGAHLKLIDCSFLGSEKTEIDSGTQSAVSVDSRRTTICLDTEAVPQAMRA